MVDNTTNHQFRLYSQGEQDWSHAPDFETLEDKVWIRDIDDNTSNYTPHADALYLATDTKKVYRGDGTNWTGPIGTLSLEARNDDGTTLMSTHVIQEGNNVTFTDSGNNVTEISASGGGSADADGIADTHDRIGAFPSGTYHDNTTGNGRWAVVFEADGGFTIQSVAVDVDISAVTTAEMPIELWEFYGEGDASNTMVDSTTVSLVDGPQRVDVNFSIPDTHTIGDHEWAITRGPNTDSELVPCRRIDSNGDGTGGWGQWSDYTFDDVDLLRGANVDEATGNDWSDSYYYIFDWEVRSAYTQVTSPLSFDVEEIYMRPRDPAEHPYGDEISPRALWFDTSQ